VETKPEDNRPRSIVFVLGGITYSEIRSAYEVARECKANLFVGSSSTMTAAKFIRGLADVDEDTDLTKIGQTPEKPRPATSKTGEAAKKTTKKGKDDESDEDEEVKEQRKKTEMEFKKIKF